MPTFVPGNSLKAVIQILCARPPRKGHRPERVRPSLRTVAYRIGDFWRMIERERRFSSELSPTAGAETSQGVSGRLQALYLGTFVFVLEVKPQ